MNKNQEIRSRQTFQSFEKALSLYEAGVLSTMSRLEEEGLIQRFGYAFELAWKALQDLLEERGYAQIREPRPVIEQSYQDAIITSGPLWLEMLRARNQTIHVYDESVFQSVSQKVKGPFLNLLQKFRSEFPK